MENINKSIYDFLDSLEDVCYPSDFLKKYDMLECLSHHNGCDTFLIQEKATKERYIAKCFDKNIYTYTGSESKILKALNHSSLPHFIDEYENDSIICIIREYINGLSLDKYMLQNHLSTEDIISIGTELCDILTYLHTQEPPIIHRDIKPQNIIVSDTKKVRLIDFDIARIYNADSLNDTQYFGTKEYAPPEQYGFIQTDRKADIYSFGILLRYMLTGSERENKNVYVYKPLSKVIEKCTAFSPKDRFSNAEAVKKALTAANPRSQMIKNTVISLCLFLTVSLITLGAVRLYDYMTFNPFAEGNIPKVLTDKERVSDSVTYMQTKFNTDLFEDTESYADIGFLKKVLSDVYKYDSEYIYAKPTAEGPPQESDKNFFPWGFGDEQYVPRDIMAYVAVKIYWVDKVSDYSSLKDDNGIYPGVRVAISFCEKNGILTGIGRPEDITKGEVAIALANADRIYNAQQS